MICALSKTLLIINRPKLYGQNSKEIWQRFFLINDHVYFKIRFQEVVYNFVRSLLNSLKEPRPLASHEG